MRMSCHGCRVLRKGCSESCSIRPCLQWIKSPEAQANATVFLAKFYGRAGLMNLINAGPDHLRPAIFRSLLYEACGRIVNPIYGSVGLLWSGNWQMCQAAVEAVLKGAPIVQIPSETAAATPTPPLKAYDIRHICRDPEAVAAAAELHKISKTSRTRFKRSSASAAGTATSKPKAASPLSPQASDPELAGAPYLDWPSRAPSQEYSSGNHASEQSHADEDMACDVAEAAGEVREVSVDTVEASHVSQGEQSSPPLQGGDVANEEEDDLGLELTLGFQPVSRGRRTDPVQPECLEQSSLCQIGL